VALWVEKDGGRNLQFSDRQLQISDSKVNVEKYPGFTLNSHIACAYKVIYRIYYIYGPCAAPVRCRISPPRFLAESRKR